MEATIFLGIGVVITITENEMEIAVDTQMEKTGLHMGYTGWKGAQVQL